MPSHLDTFYARFVEAFKVALVGTFCCGCAHTEQIAVSTSAEQVNPSLRETSAVVSIRTERTPSKHYLRFPDRRRYGTNGDGAEYVLDGRTIGFGEEGYHHLLEEIDPFPPGSTLVDVNKDIGVFIEPGPVNFVLNPYWRHSDELQAKLEKLGLKYESYLGDGRTMVTQFNPFVQREGVVDDGWEWKSAGELRDAAK